MRDMRRKKQALEDDEARAVLEGAGEGVLSLIDDEGLPYGVPVNYVLVGDTLYAHSALEGRKIDAVRANPRASFALIDRADVVPEEFTTVFRSVIVEGPVRLVADAAEAHEALMALGLKFNPDRQACEEAVAKSGGRCAVIALDVERVSGKESLRLRRERKA